MFPAQRSLLAVAFMLTASLAGEASAQPYRPDAEGYPCGSRKVLMVVQDGPGFSIRRAAEPTAAAKITTETSVAIGAALRFDRSIFANAVRRPEDETHAPRR